MRIEIERVVEIPQTYRVARCLGLFNLDMSQGAVFRIEAEIPIEDPTWKIGVIVGPSGSGKSTLASALSEQGFEDGTHAEWLDRPLIDAIGGPDFDVVTGALASVGLGSVPAWIRPYRVLSNGERFRADLARLLVQRPGQTFIDEFSSVVDRRVATIGSQAFAKAWRRGPGRVVLITPHADILPWVRPDWVLRTSSTGPTVTAADIAEVSPEVAPPDPAALVGVVRA